MSAKKFFQLLAAKEVIHKLTAAEEEGHLALFVLTSVKYDRSGWLKGWIEKYDLARQLADIKITLQDGRRVYCFAKDFIWPATPTICCGSHGVRITVKEIIYRG